MNDLSIAFVKAITYSSSMHKCSDDKLSHLQQQKHQIRHKDGLNKLVGGKFFIENSRFSEWYTKMAKSIENNKKKQYPI